jgi:cell division protein FtsW
VTRLSPAERARQATAKSKPQRALPQRGGQKQAKKTVSRAPNFRDVAAGGGAKFQVFFDRAFKAQSIHFYRLLGVTLFLVAFGMVMVLSASSIDSLVANNNSLTIFLKQVGAAILGLILMSIASVMPLSVYQKYARVFFAITMFLQVLVLLVGKSVNGNKNWLMIGPVGIQPSEFLKVSVIILLAWFVHKKQTELEITMTWYKALGIAAAAMVLVITGKDLGTVIIMMITFVGLLMLAGMPNRLMVLIAGGMVLLSPVLLTGSRMGRIMAWLNPNGPDPLNYNWQAEHGMWALAAGRIFGSGLGESKMKWSWIPEVENDFIFAIVGEELGLIGALGVILLFVFLAFSLLRIMQRTQDEFSRLIVAGVLMWIVFQALVNIAVVLRLAPVLGVPLPLISSGGSSLLASLLALGVVLAIERDNNSRPAAVRKLSRSRR